MVIKSIIVKSPNLKGKLAFGGEIVDKR